MMWGYYNVWSLLWMISMMVVLWGGVAALIVYAVRVLGAGGGDGHPR